MSSQPCQRQPGGHKLSPAFLPVPGDGPEGSTPGGTASGPHQAQRGRSESTTRGQRSTPLSMKTTTSSGSDKHHRSHPAVIYFHVYRHCDYPVTLSVITGAFVRLLRSARTDDLMAFPLWDASVAEDGSTHAASSHPLTAPAERQLLNTLTPERPVEVEAAGCARWLKPL